MGNPSRTIAIAGFTLAASAYFAVGVLGSLEGVPPRLVPLLSVLSSLLAGAAIPLCRLAVWHVRALRDSLRAREAPLGHARTAT